MIRFGEFDAIIIDPLNPGLSAGLTSISGYNRLLTLARLDQGDEWAGRFRVGDGSSYAGVTNVPGGVNRLQTATAIQNAGGTNFVTTTDTGTKVRLDVNSAQPAAHTQSFSNTAAVTVDHGLGQFPTVSVYRTVYGTAFGPGGFGVGGFGLSGGALPDYVLNRQNAGFALFYIDTDTFRVLFPAHQQSGVLEWREV